MIDKVLCVDDDPITLMLCKKVLEKSEFTNNIDTAQNGEVALHYFLNLKKEIENGNNNLVPKIVFLDLNMPIMNGWELLDSFLENKLDLFFTQTSFIVLSSTIDPQDIEKSKTYDIVLDFISKPISKEVLEKYK